MLSLIIFVYVLVLQCDQLRCESGNESSLASSTNPGLPAGLRNESENVDVAVSQKKRDSSDKYFIRRIFDKYGTDGKMTIEGFEHLMESVGIAEKIKDHQLKDHYVEGTFDGHIHQDHRNHVLKKGHAHMHASKAPNGLDEHDGHDHHDSKQQSSSSSSHEDHPHHDHVREEKSFEEVNGSSNPVSANLSESWSPDFQNNLVIETRCLSPSEILARFQLNGNTNPISERLFMELCPAIVYELDVGLCSRRSSNLLNNPLAAATSSHNHEQQNNTSLFHLWLYGAGSVVLISIIGLLGINVIPLIQQHHHGDVLQLLVGLAIGTLTSDALLHLLPHAFMENKHSHKEQHSHGYDGGLDDHSKGVWYGMMALMGIIGFLIFERVITILSDLFTKSSRKTSKISNCNRAVGEKLSNHNLSSDATSPAELDKLNESLKMSAANEKVKPLLSENAELGYLNSTQSVNPSNDIQLTTEQCHRETIVYQHNDPDKGFVVQLTDHHHHHQHQHQKGAKSVILMIVTGDGMHNFFDGLAIGVAFVGGGLGGGFSTSVAILFHELPHEVGDFAVLLSAGLSVKRAVMYNTLSAILCFIGMTVGVIVGNMDTAMLSAVIAGMFLYIALVNMIPQLDCCPTSSKTTRAFKLSVQLIGISIGVAIMCGISLYESRIQNLLS